MKKIFSFLLTLSLGYSVYINIKQLNERKNLLEQRSSFTLSAATIAGDAQLVRSILQRKEFGAKDSVFPDKPLVWAIYFDYQDVTKALLKAIPPETPALHTAVFYQRRDLFDFLVQKNADIQAPDGFGLTPLMWACMLNLPVETQKLIQLGAKTDVRYVNQFTPLMYAALNKSPKLAKVLLEGGVDPNLVIPGANISALHFAAYRGDLETLSALLEAKALRLNELDYQGLTPLHIAVKENHIDLVRSLVRAGADVSVKDFYGNSVIDLASQLQREEIFNFLSFKN